jgi:hypothetical protein
MKRTKIASPKIAKMQNTTDAMMQARNNTWLKSFWLSFSTMSVK